LVRVGALLLALTATPAGAECRQALALGLDVSGSVDAREYALQVQGLAAALGHEDVAAILLDQPEWPVWIAVYDWSGPEDIRLIQPWVAIDGAESLQDVRARIAGTPRAAGAPQTAVGSAMLFGEYLLAQRGDCPARVLDLSGDGKSNIGPQPRSITLPGWMIVNALVIGADNDASWDGGEPGIAELTAWFKADVLRGPGAFVETALGFEDFEAAMIRKLTRELTGLRLGGPGPGHTGPG